MKTKHGVNIRIKKHISENYFCLEASTEFDAINLAMTLEELNELKKMIEEKIENEERNRKCC